MDETVTKYSVSNMKDSIEEVYTELFGNRKKEINDTLSKYKVDNIEEKKG